MNAIGFTVGLTGGIGSGKSEAAKQFAKLGVPVVDTDVIAHSLTAAGMPLLTEIAHIFGEKFINVDGSLNRSLLRTHVFGNTNERQKLEALLHPAIYQFALKQLAENQQQLHPSYQILVVPLLFEGTSYQSIVNKTLVIDCDESKQIKHTMARSNLSESEVKAIIQTQTPSSIKRTLADEVIENNGSIQNLQEKINKIHKKFIKTCIVSK
jgi:dephospho-CoA kinase